MGRFGAATLALFGGLAGCMAVGAAFTGCGGDDTTTTDGGTADTGTGTDTGAPDTSSDVTTHDVTVADAHDAAADVTTTMDAAPDVHEAGMDATDASHADASHADADAAPTTDASDGGSSDGDAGIVDAGSDVVPLPPGLVAYPQMYANAICTGFANCCGATFDVATCESSLNLSGYDNTLPTRPIFSSGNLTFNADAGAACVAALGAWPCGTTITDTQNAAILAACHGVLGGTIPIGSTGCQSSFECVDGAYCAPGAAPRMCVALAGDGGACSPAGESPDEQCSYIGTALPSLYCDVYPNDGGGDGGPPTGVCMPALAVGPTSLCTDGINYYSDYACINRGCDFGNTGACAAAIPNPADPASQFECANYVLPADAGSE